MRYGEMKWDLYDIHSHLNDIIYGFCKYEDDEDELVGQIMKA